ncbi:MAG TPA: ABC transporter permease [Cyclobacteriaceae bacterium]|nr:ABC transporter permease [Cyclobacteriaceae bacterium]
MTLQSEHIDFIIKDLHRRGLLLDGFKDEVVDHVCSAIEGEMARGERFMDAYQKVISSFGGNDGLQQTQDLTIQYENKKLKVMIQNYFTIAFRNLKKQRFYTAINIAGLAVGVASCLIIVLFVMNELSYDKHWSDNDRLFRAQSEIKFGDNHLIMAVTPGPLAETLMKDFPEVESAARFWNYDTYIFKHGDETFKEPNSVFADSNIFRIFDMHFVAGDPHTALKEPNSMVITQKIAEKYFPGQNALGQSITSNSNKSWKITGIVDNAPKNGHFHFNFMLSLVSVEYNKDPNWLSNNFNTYVKLRKGADAKALEAKFPTMIDTYAGPQAKAALGADFTMEKFRAAGNKIEFTLIPVTDIHLKSDRMAEMEANSDITYVYIFSIIAGFILIVACINFMNLSTARSSNRAKEVGIRKVMGSMRSHLVRQFLTESVLLSIFSFLIAIGLAWMAVPLFNELALKELSIPFQSPVFWLLIGGCALITGVLAGLYPSFFLSAFRPVNVLKGNLALGTKSGVVRGALVVFQFWISIVLVVGTIAVNRQLNYIQNTKIGFNKDQIIVIRDAYVLGDQLQSFKEEVEKDTRIISGTISAFLPVSNTARSDNTHWPEGKAPTDENMVSIQVWRVDYDYVKTLGMKIIQGRDFSKEFLSDSSGVILNQAAVKMFGYQDDPIGKKISTFAESIIDGTKKLKTSTIVGVVEDFNFESLRQNIGPLALFLEKSSGRISFRFEAKNTQEVIKTIESQWKKLGPGQPFDYSFLDEDFGNMYSAEQRLGRIFTVFAVLAIIIACLGLFALTAFTAEQRTKEIGIRKVLGASVSGIVVLLSKEFGKLILIAFILAAPVAWYGIDKWLESYQYKTEIGVFVYLLAGLAAFGIAWLTMSFQSIKAALANPIKSLRSE